MHSTIKIGVMGCANIAQRSVIPAILSHPDFKLVAVASRTLEKATKLATQFDCKAIEGYDSLLQEDIDVVYMPLPTGLHEEWVIKSLESDKHLFVEKSFSMNADSAKKMVTLATEKKRIIMENFMFPYHSQHNALLKLINENTIGEIRNMRASFGFPPLAKGNFRYDVTVGGGALLDAAAYTAKISQLILGTQCEVLSASLGIDKATGADIMGSAHLLFKGKISAQLAWGFSHFYQCGVELWGSLGRISTNRTFTSAVGFQPSIKLEVQGKTIEYTLPADNHFHNILSVLADNIRQQRYKDTLAEISMQSQVLTEIAQKAHRYEINQ